MTNFTDERIAEARARCEAATKNPTLDRYGHGGGRASAGDELVADYYNEGDREFYHAARTDLPDALDALVEARRERDEAEALLLALHKAHHLDQGLEWKVDNLLHERGILENGNDAR